MAKKSYRMAINDALRSEMRRNPDIIILGEDVAGGQGARGEVGVVGSVFGVLGGLYKEFGPTRVIDTPISESAIIGAAAGAALTGLRPVAEIMFVDFVGVCFDQILQPSRQVPLHVRRQGENADDYPRHHRSRLSRRGAAQPVDASAFHVDSRSQGRDAVERL